MSQELAATLEILEERIAAIEARNRRVELEKAWETSVLRRLAILVLTYFVMCLVFAGTGNTHVFSSAVVPTLGFFLSTLSLPILKGWWSAKR